MQVRGRATGFVRTEGGILPADLLERVRSLDRKLPGLDVASYGLARHERFGEAITRSWNRLVGAWTTFQDELRTVPETDPATTLTRERLLLPLFEELSYGRLTPAKAVELDGKSYPVSHAYDRVALHLVGANVPLDRRSRGVAGAAGQSPHGLLQELLNRSPERLWGIVSNGRTLRILRDNASLTRQAYLDFDLEAIFGDEAYADFALLWHLAHRTRLEARVADGAEEGRAASVEACYLERWSQLAAETGARARDRLRDGVQEAIEAIGSGILAHPANGELRAALQAGELSTQDYYRQLLRLVYRLILLFVAEDRDLLLDPRASTEIRERYTHYYSTARLRRLAERRRGSRHADLYAGLRVVIEALGSDDGAPGIGLPPLGGFLFGPDACPHVDRAELANADLLEAVRKLATIEERGVLRVVDYRNLGSEELGSIYESLLELHPELDTAAPSFALRTAAGHERKTTGSYYTPTSLISVLLDSALDPVLAEAADKPSKEEAERAILELAVVDPAAGSGHFLVAAAHRIAKRLAQIRTGDEEPAPGAIRTALRDVIGHCLYAVDVNPMAVELCKVSLWLEALEPGKPLTFLDAHIKCGNSLLGTTPDLMAEGIPDAAYDPIEGDDKAIGAALRKRNRAERAGQRSLLEEGLALSLESLRAAAEELDALPDDDPRALKVKEAAHRDALSSEEHRRVRVAADAWMASFVAPKRHGGLGITTATVRALAATSTVTIDVGAQVGRLANEGGFFHWPLEFAHVFGRGGFDVALGNPPWEKVQFEERQFFAARAPEIANARNAAARKRAIAALRDSDTALWSSYVLALRHSDVESHFFRTSGRFPLTGLGRPNTYALFAELMRNVIGPRGRVGVIVPTGIATDDSAKRFFGELVQKRCLVSIHSFENEEFIFPAVHHAFRFCLLTVSGSSASSTRADFVFYARRVTQLADEERHFTLTADEFRLLNPNTMTCPTFRSRRDAEIAKRVYQRIPVLVRGSEPDGNPWRVAFMQGVFNMASDSHLFRDSAHPERVPLHEAKLIHQYTNRWATYEAGEARLCTNEELENSSFSVQPRYWVDVDEVRRRLHGRWEREWLLGWRDITGAEKVRTAISAAIPFSGAGGIHLLLSPHPFLPFVLANVNCFAFDWLARQKVGGTHLAFFVMEQLPVLPPHSFGERVQWADISLGGWLRRYLVELMYTSWDMEAFGRDLGWVGPPFVWNRGRRADLMAEVDGAFFHLYGMTRDEVEHVMDSFWIVRERDEKEDGRYRTKELVLGAYDEVAAAVTNGRPFETRLSPGPGDPEASHRGAGISAGRWTPWQAISHGVKDGSIPEVVGRPARDGYVVPVGKDLAHPGKADPKRRDSERIQPSLAHFLPADDGWQPEAAVDPSTLILGGPVKHRSFGVGTILAVRNSGRSTTLLIRFGSGQREIAFGYGLLEFPQQDQAES